MNEQLEAALVEIINRAVSGYDASISFLSEQLPDVVSQLLIWEFTHNFIIFLLSLGALGIAYYLSRKIMNNKEFFDGHQAPPATLVAILAWFVGAIVFSLLVNFTWLKILVAPKLYLIEYAATLVK